MQKKIEKPRTLDFFLESWGYLFLKKKNWKRFENLWCSGMTERKFGFVFEKVKISETPNAFFKKKKALLEHLGLILKEFERPQEPLVFFMESV